MEASEHGHTEVVKLLLSREADPKKVATVSCSVFSLIEENTMFKSRNTGALHYRLL